MHSTEVSTDGGSTSTGLQRVVALAAFVFLPLTSLHASAGGVAFWVLALIGCWCCVSSKLRPTLSRHQWMLLLLAGLLPVALNVASVTYFGLPSRQISWVPFVGGVLIVVAVWVSGWSIRVVVMGATLASFALLFITTLAVVGFAHERPSLTMNALLYGKTGVICMLFTAWGLGEEKDRKIRLLMFLSLLAGLAALLLTGYRGGWFVLPLIGLALLLNRRLQVEASVARNGRGAFALMAAVAAVAVVSANYSAVERVQKLSDELQAYNRGVVNNSSVGSRIAMWKSATRMFSEQPVFGVGAHEYHSRLQKFQAQGAYPADAKLYRHAHNSYLNIAAEYGLIGLLVMTISALALVRLLWSLPPRFRQLGLLILGSWMLMALTNDVLAHQSLIRTMAFGFAVTLGFGLRAA